MNFKNPQAPAGYSIYGAPMGRHSQIPPDSNGFKKRCRCFRLRFRDGGYDEGGAYWGTPANVYCATNGEYEQYIRAGSRTEAKAWFKKHNPLIKWVN